MRQPQCQRRCPHGSQHRCMTMDRSIKIKLKNTQLKNTHSVKQICIFKKHAAFERDIRRGSVDARMASSTAARGRTNQFDTLCLSKSAAHQGKSREWGRMPPRPVGQTNQFDTQTLMIVSVWLAHSLGGVPREQKMLKGHLPRVIYHQAY